MTGHGPAAPAVGVSPISRLPAESALRLMSDGVTPTRNRAASAVRGRPRTAEMRALDDRSPLPIGDPPGPDLRALSAITLVAIGAGFTLIAVFETLGIRWAMMAHA